MKKSNVKKHWRRRDEEKALNSLETGADIWRHMEDKNKKDKNKQQK